MTIRVLRLIFFSLCFSFFSIGAHAADCASPITNTSTGAKSECTLNNDAIGVDLYGLWLCQQTPTYSTYQNVCEEVVYNINTPQEIRVTIGGETNITANGNLSLPLGTYTHAVLLVRNMLYSKGSVQFDSGRKGKTGSGVYCWTIDGSSFAETAINSLAVECGSSAGTAGFMKSEKQCWTGSCVFEKLNNDKTSSINDAYALSAPTVQSTSASDTAYLLGIAAFKDGYKPTITNTTKRVVMGFELTGNGKVRLRSSFDGANCHDSSSVFGCVTGIMQQGFEFIVEVE